MDGSQKLPQRILGTVADNLARGHVPKGLCLAVAGWMRYVGGIDERGAVIDVRDPLSNQLKRASDEAEDKVAALLGISDVFGPDLPNDERFTPAVRHAYDALTMDGARGAVRAYLAS